MGPDGDGVIGRVEQDVSKPTRIMASLLGRLVILSPSSQEAGLNTASHLILLAYGVMPQIVAQLDDVLLHDGELVT